MRYFAYLADQSFQTDTDGNIQFFPQGVFSRPYIVPTVEQKQRIHAKLTWVLRIFLGGIILGIVLSNGFFLRHSFIFISLLIGLTTLQYIVLRFLLRNELRAMKRSDTHVSLRRFYSVTAARHSLKKLILGFAGSILFVVTGFFMLYEGASPAIAIACVLFSGLCAVVWGYALMIKIRMNEPGQSTSI